MRIIFSVIFLFVFPVLAFSQRAYDGELIVGLDGRIITFSDIGQPSLQTPVNDFALYSYGSSAIADKKGKLAIACSGVTVVNRLGNRIVDSGLNYDIGTRKFTDWTSGWPKWTQQSIILPKATDEYYIFTYTMSDGAYDDWIGNIFFRTDMLSYHVVDMKENNGLGKVIVKNQILMKDAILSSNRLTAVKHGNGRDWWLVAPHQKEHVFYLFLVTQEGVSGPFTKSVDYPVIDSFFGGQYGQSTFNRNGDKYAYCTSTSKGIYVLNFDRCTGDFSKYHFYSLPRDTTLSLDWPSGTTFSPNDSFLYASTSYNIFQFDIYDTSANSIQFIHGPDVDSANEFFQEYSNLYIGGDDKLYIGNFHGVKSTMSYIEYPNRRGNASGFCRRCLQIPNNNAQGLPNIPNYHLGKKVGSVCDTLNPIIPIEQYTVYPNPSSGQLSIAYEGTAEREAVFTLYDMLGNVILKKTDIGTYVSFEIPNIANGVYTYSITDVSQIYKRGKLIIER